MTQAWTRKSNSECFTRRGLSFSAKLTVYKAIVVPLLLYGSETWLTLAHHIRRLEIFHQRSLRQIMGVKWWQLITNAEILILANSTIIEIMVRGNRLQAVEGLR